MEILVLVAGTNDPSNSNVLSDSFIEGIQEAGEITVNKRQLKDMKIDHFDLSYYDPKCKMEKDFSDLQKLMEQASGLVIATPIWNFGVPAHLKNFVDRMGSFALDDTRSRVTLGGKPFYIIFTGGAPLPAWKGMMKATSSYLPEALKYFGGSYMGHHFEGKCTVGRGKFGLVVDGRPESLAAVRKKGVSFASVVKTFKETGKAPIKQRAHGKLMKWSETLLKKVS